MVKFVNEDEKGLYSEQRKDVLEHFEVMGEMLAKYLDILKVTGFSIDIDFAWVGHDPKKEAVIVVQRKGFVGDNVKQHETNGTKNGRHGK